MRKNFCLLIFLWVSDLALGQTNTLKILPKALIGAQNSIISIVGKTLFEKHFTLDTLDSRSSWSTSFVGDVKKSISLGRDTIFSIVYFVIQAKDTVGYIDISVYENGDPLNEWREPYSSAKPEVLLGYKKLLNNQLPVTYSKALAIGQGKGFTDPPYLDARTIYHDESLNKHSFIQVSFFWTFYKTAANQNGVLLIDAETGKVEAEKYFFKLEYK